RPSRTVEQWSKPVAGRSGACRCSFWSLSPFVRGLSLFVRTSNEERSLQNEEAQPSRTRRRSRPERRGAAVPNEEAQPSRTRRRSRPERGGAAVPNEEAQPSRTRRRSRPERGGAAVPNEEAQPSRT